MAKQNPIKKELIKGVIGEECIKCKTNNWIKKRVGFRIVYECKKCGYVFDWFDYIKAGMISAKTIKAGYITKPDYNISLDK